MKHGTHWSMVDLAAARLMYDQGAEYHDIGEAIGRTDKAVYDMLRKRFGATRALKEVYDGPAIGRTLEDDRLARDAKLGSQILGEACLYYFCCIANSAGRSRDEVIAEYANGRERKEPGQERFYRGQAAERLAVAA